MILVPTWCILTLSRAIMNQHSNWWLYSLMDWGEIFHLGLEPLLITMISLSNFFVFTFYSIFFPWFFLPPLTSTTYYPPLGFTYQLTTNPPYLVTYSLYLFIYSPILPTYLPTYLPTLPIYLPTYLPISYLPILLTNLTTNLFTPLTYLSTHLHTYLTFTHCHC
jgi:hypothetical protein